MVGVEVENRSGAEVDEAAAVELAQRVLGAEGIEDGELGLAFAGPEEIRALKRDHLGIDDLSGPAGSGKTHLVHIWAARAGATIVPAIATSSGLGITDLGTNAAVAVEDVPAHGAPEAPLFHLINSVRELGGSLLLTSRSQARTGGSAYRTCVPACDWPLRPRLGRRKTNFCARCW